MGTQVVPVTKTEVVGGWWPSLQLLKIVMAVTLPGFKVCKSTALTVIVYYFKICDNNDLCHSISCGS